MNSIKITDNISLKKLAEFFWKLEKEFDLIHYEINDVKVWQYQRFRIFLTIARQLGVFNHAHTKKTKFLEILSAAPSLLYNSIFSNPILGNYNKETLVFSSGRKIKVNEWFIDIYTEYFIDKLKNGSFEIIEELYLNRHLPSETKNRKHQDYQQISTFLKSKLSIFKLNKKQLLFISEIEKFIKTKLGAEINLKTLFRNGYLTFKNDFEFYNKLIRKRKPTKIFLICSYGYKMALVAAAKQNQVETIEIQHGTVNKYHLGYSYPNHSYIDYFPDKIYFWSEYWKNCMHFPLAEENKFVSGFPYFRNQKERFQGVSKIPKQVLIISQGTIGNQLSEFIWKSRDVLKNYKVIYKLHPGEFDRWVNEYPCLNKLNELDNISIIDNNNSNLYSYLAKSEFVVGVYSTAVYDALSFNCKVILADLPGVEFLEDLAKLNYIKKVFNTNDLQNSLISDTFNKLAPDYFF